MGGMYLPRKSKQSKDSQLAHLGAWMSKRDEKICQRVNGDQEAQKLPSRREPRRVTKAPADRYSLHRWLEAESDPWSVDRSLQTIEGIMGESSKTAPGVGSVAQTPSREDDTMRNIDHEANCRERSQDATKADSASAKDSSGDADNTDPDGLLKWRLSRD